MRFVLAQGGVDGVPVPHHKANEFLSFAVVVKDQIAVFRSAALHHRQKFAGGKRRAR